jgi:hypothetical protein
MNADHERDFRAIHASLMGKQQRKHENSGVKSDTRQKQEPYRRAECGD